MSKYVCSICGYIHQEAVGAMWDDLGETWVCPLCKASKSAFRKESTEAQRVAVEQPLDLGDDMRQLSVLEMSILCSNLARGCEKQYKQEESDLFTKLADYFKGAAPVVDGSFGTLTSLVQEDLEEHIVLANQNARANHDRGAQRALVWNEKVTLILQSILTRYEQEGAAMLKDTQVYVCTICGFIFIGNQLPDLCPVCKVPNWKFDRVEGGE